MTNIALTLTLCVLAAPAILAGVYLLVLTLCSGQASPPKAPALKRLRFDVVIPAHNEASIIANTVTSVKKIDWPSNLFRIVVVADNCSDDTAQIAEHHGATVIKRADLTKRGKGYALQYAFAWSAADRFADAVAVIDADAEVSTNLLAAFAARIEAGEHAVQVHYGILNPWVSWRTRLITIAKSAFHIVRSRARERLKVSCGIRGNGWCVTHELLTKVPYAAFSLTEDVEYGITLGMHGYRVAYADEAHSDAEMVSGQQAAEKQRQRWEVGRFQLIRAKTWPLLVSAVRNRSLVCADLALDLMVLPLSYVVMNIIALLLVACIGAFWHPALSVFIWIGAACFAALSLHILRGWQLSGIGLRGVFDLAHVPVFLFWKMMLFIRQRGQSEWVRTEREKQNER